MNPSEQPRDGAQPENQPENQPAADDRSQQSPDQSSDGALLPVVPMRNLTVFPYVFSPLVVVRPNSISALEAALATEEKTFIVVTQKDPEQDQPHPQDLYPVGTKVVIKQMARDGDVFHALVQGTHRVTLGEYDTSQPFLKASYAPLNAPREESDSIEGVKRAVLDLVEEVLRLAHPERADQLYDALKMAEDQWHLIFLITSMLQLDPEQQQEMLQLTDVNQALKKLIEQLKKELSVQKVRSQITEKTRSKMSKQEREYLLRQQMKAIQEELGETSGGAGDVADIEKSLRELELPDEVQRETERELRRLKQLNPSSPDYQLTRSYLELVTELPWSKLTSDDMDLEKARRILDEDHYGLDEIKERILEHLAVMKLNPDADAPILCFVGPPGVGKTSLGQSIARSLGRQFERLSLGGLSDESELRGHRRTYIGAMPGRIIQGIRRAGVMNPLMMLDEVDKLGRDFRGDPASALLEILDPAQNHTFRDNYLDMPFDLSRVFFIATANSLDPIPRPLLDRMEVVQLAGYTNQEKLEIAKRYLIPRQVQESGIRSEDFQVSDKTLLAIISQYTRESGVRKLEQAIGKLARKVALAVASDGQPVAIETADLDDMLGRRVRRDLVQRDKLPLGVATGLAWTQTGGEVLYIEAVLLPAGGNLTLTGQLGDVMRESAQAARSFLWSHAKDMNIDPAVFKDAGLHIHVPAGAVPKDGPSAGVAMVTAMSSVFTNIPARADTAMTGEITLSGDVLAIGGIKEKCIAAHSAGIKRVCLPAENKTDAKEIPPEVRENLEIIFVERIDELLKHTLDYDHQSPVESVNLPHANPAAAASS